MLRARLTLSLILLGALGVDDLGSAQILGAPFALRKAQLALDAASLPALAAYGLRRLRVGYTGPLVRVRRSSDDTEQDFYPLAGTGNLDTVALLAFTGAGDGFVKTWYDQSGNGVNASQTTTTKQPKIVTAGVTETLANHPTLTFSGSQHFSNITLGSNGVFFNLVVAPNATGAYHNFYDNSGAASMLWIATDNKFEANIGTHFSSANGTLRIASIVNISPSSADCYINGALSLGACGNYRVTTTYSLFNRGGLQAYNGKASEFIITAAVTATQRAILEDNQVTHFQ